MESPCLSILVPLLVKGLRERAAVARKTGLIIHNMVKVGKSPTARCQRQKPAAVWLLRKHLRSLRACRQAQRDCPGRTRLSRLLQTYIARRFGLSSDGT